MGEEIPAFTLSGLLKQAYPEPVLFGGRSDCPQCLGWGRVCGVFGYCECKDGRRVKRRDRRNTVIGLFATLTLEQRAVLWDAANG